MSNEIIGWSPLSSLGDGVIGELGAEFDVKLVGGPYSVGLFTTNTDPDIVGVDPVTGDPLPVGTDMGFGPSIRRFMQSGIYNGDFSAPPPDTTANISDDNKLPYWKYVPAASGSVTAKWIADPTSGSGGLLRWTVTEGTDGDTAYIEQIIPVNSSHTRAWAYWPTTAFSARSDVGNSAMSAWSEAQYLQADGTTTTGIAETVQASVATAGDMSLTWHADEGVVPDDAAFLRYRTGASRLTTAADTNSFDMYEAYVITSSGSFTILVDRTSPATYPPTYIKKDLGYTSFLNAATNGTQMAIGANSDQIGLLVRGKSGQTADILAIDTWTGADLVVVDSAGKVGIGADPAAQLEVKAGAATTVGLTVTAAAAQSANLLVIEDSAGTDLVVVDSAGLVGIGTDPAYPIDIATTLNAMQVTRHIDTSAGPGFFLRKSRSATVGTNTLVQDDDTLGAIVGAGGNGSTYVSAAAIYFQVDGDPFTASDATDMPGRLVFFTTPDGSGTLTERMRIENNGRIIAAGPLLLQVGGGASVTGPSVNGSGGLPIQVLGNTQATSSIVLGRYLNDAYSGGVNIYKSRGASVGTKTAVVDDDSLGFLAFHGEDGTAGIVAARIEGQVDGTVGTNDMPGRLVFYTTADGASSATERARIDSTGRLLIGITSATDTNAILELSKGINFPDTQVASSDVNTLDDYEEGTWTPAITFATVGDLSVAYSGRAGRYVKIGSRVYWEFTLSTSTFTHTTATGNLQITGWPFTAAGLLGGLNPVIGSASVRGYTKAGFTQINVFSVSAYTVAELRASGSGVTATSLAVGDMPTGGTVDIRAQGYFTV